MKGRAPGDLPGSNVGQHKAQLVEQVPHLGRESRNQFFKKWQLYKLLHTDLYYLLKKTWHASKPCWREWTWSSSRWGRSLRSVDSQNGRRAWWSTMWHTAAMGHRRMSAAASCLLLKWTELCCWTWQRKTRNQWPIFISQHSMRLYWFPKLFSQSVWPLV